MFSQTLVILHNCSVLAKACCHLGQLPTTAVYFWHALCPAAHLSSHATAAFKSSTNCCTCSWHAPALLFACAHCTLNTV